MPSHEIVEIEPTRHRNRGELIMTRILIADDHDVVRSGLRTILEAQPNLAVVAEAADGKEAVLKAVETTPDVAVLDYSLPLISGSEATRQIRARSPRTESTHLHNARQQQRHRGGRERGCARLSAQVRRRT